MAIKAVIFDCFGVLVIPGRAKLFSDFPDYSAELTDLETRLDYGMMSRSEYDQALTELTGLSAAETESRYWYIGKRNDPVIDWVKQLKKQGEYKLALLSNVGIDWMGDFIPESERNEMFDEVVLSSDVHMTKPHPKIFEYAADKLSLSPSECIFIDDMMANVESAQLVGMTGVLFGTFDQAKSDVEIILGE